MGKINRRKMTGSAGSKMSSRKGFDADDCKSRTSRRRSIQLDIELYMECEEEPLSPMQRTYTKTLQKEYSDALSIIREARKDPTCQLIRLAKHDDQLPLLPMTHPFRVQSAQIATPPPVINLSNSPSPIKRLPLNSVTMVSKSNSMSPVQSNIVPTKQANADIANIPRGASLPDISSTEPWKTTTQNEALGKIASRRKLPPAMPMTQACKIKPIPDSDNWVALDEFYYGKKEGTLAYVEEKGEFKFKRFAIWKRLFLGWSYLDLFGVTSSVQKECYQCSKILYNNLKLMLHTQAHIDCDKQQNLDLSDLTQCKRCYQQFDTPFDMQTHIEKVHTASAEANVLMCRICEKDHMTQTSLTQHMRQNHVSCEMPYICQLCGFRSSLYQDVEDHFKKKHDNSSHVMCPYCLKVFRIAPTQAGYGRTMAYFQHLLKHQSKTHTRKCSSCKLVFMNTLEVKLHKNKDHGSNYRTAHMMVTGKSSGIPLMMWVSSDKRHGGGVTSLNDPGVQKNRDFSGIKVADDMEDMKCFECGALIHGIAHFKKYVECTMCRYATCCNAAYANHMMTYHMVQSVHVYTYLPKQQPLIKPLYCWCGYTSMYGNSFANHMVACMKVIAYFTKPTIHVQSESGTVTEPTTARTSGSSLLDILGLMKRDSNDNGSNSNSPTTLEGGDDFISDYLISKRKRKAPRKILNTCQAAGASSVETATNYEPPRGQNREVPEAVSNVRIIEMTDEEPEVEKIVRELVLQASSVADVNGTSDGACLPHGVTQRKNGNSSDLVDTGCELGVQVVLHESNNLYRDKVENSEGVHGDVSSYENEVNDISNKMDVGSNLEESLNEGNSLKSISVAGIYALKNVEKDKQVGPVMPWAEEKLDCDLNKISYIPNEKTDLPAGDIENVHQSVAEIRQRGNCLNTEYLSNSSPDGIFDYAMEKDEVNGDSLQEEVCEYHPRKMRENLHEIGKMAQDCGTIGDAGSVIDIVKSNSDGRLGQTQITQMIEDNAEMQEDSCKTKVPEGIGAMLQMEYINDIVQEGSWAMVVMEDHNEVKAGSDIMADEKGIDEVKSNSLDTEDADKVQGSCAMVLTEDTDDVQGSGCSMIDSDDIESVQTGNHDMVDTDKM